ncbi:MAG: endonuclease/exonuclease/phosphatase family protein [Phycisphaerales bacterium]|nr:endonuclease/exonuclease/phosphatase family protein [Phycisphaerales bacterium]MCI0674630.1 endonuclease/exonuclease/phosphatase family protein [Phycisphaerales bacterium]
MAETQSGERSIGRTTKNVLARGVWLACWTLSAVALLIVVSWFIGRVATDRYAWSQWLWWIPTPAVLLASAVGFAVALRPAGRAGRRRRRQLFWGASGVAILTYFATVEHRLLGSEPISSATSNTIKVVHWNISHRPLQPNIEQIVAQLVELDGDVTVITNPSSVPWQPAMIEKLGAGQQPISIGTFGLSSRFPILSTRALIAMDGIWIVEVEIDASAKLGRSVIVYLVDLPSNPRIPRMEQARRIRRSLDDAARLGGSAPPRPPDLIVGDFNITRGSASLDCMFPNMDHAFDQAGHGYGATFPRQRPMWHIDHTLVGASVKALRYKIDNPGISRHRTQIAWIGLQ